LREWRRRDEGKSNLESVEEQESDLESDDEDEDDKESDDDKSRKDGSQEEDSDDNEDFDDDSGGGSGNLAKDMPHSRSDGNEGYDYGDDRNDAQDGRDDHRPAFAGVSRSRSRRAERCKSQCIKKAIRGIGDAEMRTITVHNDAYYNKKKAGELEALGIGIRDGFRAFSENAATLPASLSSRETAPEIEPDAVNVHSSGEVSK